MCPCFEAWKSQKRPLRGGVSSRERRWHLYGLRIIYSGVYSILLYNVIFSYRHTGYLAHTYTYIKYQYLLCVCFTLNYQAIASHRRRSVLLQNQSRPFLFHASHHFFFFSQLNSHVYGLHSPSAVVTGMQTGGTTYRYVSSSYPQGAWLHFSLHRARANQVRIIYRVHDARCSSISITSIRT